MADISKLLEQLKESNKQRNTQQVELKGVNYIEIKGDKGDKGHSPTKSELLDLMKSVLPNKQELMSWVNNLVPKERDLVYKVLKQIPTPKDGRTPVHVGNKKPVKPQIGDLWIKN